MLFKLDGDHTLGRNESRKAILLANRDYCKLHIIFHYIAVLLDANHREDFKLFPIGRVGNDEAGKRLLNEMCSVGMFMESVAVTQDMSTLFSVCFQYPDTTGGNITSSNGASSKVSSDDISAFFQKYKQPEGSGILLAVPEVPVEARIKLLEEGKKRNCYNIASVLVSEIDEFRKRGGFEKTDLLSVNIDEARAIAGIEDAETDSKEIVTQCISVVKKIHPQISIVISDSREGSYAFQNDTLEYIPPLKTTAITTGGAGAGDAMLAGIIVGLCCGLPFIKRISNTYFSETPIFSSVELGTLLASLSVTSPDTIHSNADARMLLNYAERKNIHFSLEFAEMFI